MMKNGKIKPLPLAAAVFAILPLSLMAFKGGELAAFLEYRFIRRALIVGSLVALCAALLGVILVLKRYAMIGDGLSHVGFGALTGAMALGCITVEQLPSALPLGVREGLVRAFGAIAASPMPFTLIVVSACAIWLLRLSRNSAVHGDSAIAVLSTSALAFGVIITSSVKGMNIDVTNYLFGSILAISEADVWSSVVLSVLVVAAFVLLYPRIFAVTFDEPFFRAGGGAALRYNWMIAVLTAVTVVLGMRLMGTMLISSLIIFPALTAMRLCDSYFRVVVCAAVVSVACFVTGIMLSCLFSLPAGAGIVAVNLAAFIIAGLMRRFA